MLQESSLTQFLIDPDNTEQINNEENLVKTIASLLFPRWHLLGLSMLLRVPYWTAYNWTKGKSQMPAHQYELLIKYLKTYSKRAYFLADLCDKKAAMIAATPRKPTGCCDPAYYAAQRKAKEAIQADL